MASVSKYKDGRWRVMFCVDGYRTSKVIEAKTKKQAMMQAALMEQSIKETGSIDGQVNNDTGSSSMMFMGFCDKYMDWCTTIRANPIRPKTEQKYRDIINYHLKPYFRGIKLGQIKQVTVEGFIKYMRSPEARVNKSNKRAYSDATVKDAYTLLEAILKRAVQLELIRKNPCANVEKPTIKDRGPMAYYDDKQIITMLRALDKETNATLAKLAAMEEIGTYQPFTIQKEKINTLYNKVMVYIAIHTAARRGEILGLHRQDIDFNSMTINFRHNVLYTREKGTFMEDTLKTVDSNTVAINEDLANLLKELIAEVDKLFTVSNGVIPYTDRLFMGLRKTSRQEPGGLPFPDPYSDWFKLFLARNNLPPITFHKLRHSSLSFMLHSGVDPFTVAKIAGHSSLEQIHKTYGHVYDEAMAQAANVFNRIKEGGDKQ